MLKMCRRHALLYIKASVVIFILCFTYVQLAAIRKPKDGDAGDKADILRSVRGVDQPVVELAEKAIDNGGRLPAGATHSPPNVLLEQNHKEIDFRGHKIDIKEEHEPENENFGAEENGQIAKEENDQQNIKEKDIQPVAGGDVGIEKSEQIQKPELLEPGADGAGGQGGGGEAAAQGGEGGEAGQGGEEGEAMQGGEGVEAGQGGEGGEAGQGGEGGEAGQGDLEGAALGPGEDEDEEGEGDDAAKNGGDGRGGQPRVEDEDPDEDKDQYEEEEFPRHLRLHPPKALRVDEVEPPDHLDAVRLEQDGHLNKEYRKEILLGNHEEFENEDDLDPEDILSTVFEKVDTNNDEFINVRELEEWIVTKVQEHFAEANAEAERVFKHLDVDKDGHVSWRDFHFHFLLARGNDFRKAEKHVDDYETIPLDPNDKERLIRYKFRWAEADEEPQDNRLTLQEFKSFRHPEQSKVMINRMVEDMIENLDRDNDGEVSEEEFVSLPPGDVDDSFLESDQLWMEERRKEFRFIMDVNKDGRLTRAELKNYVDPQNPSHARVEAENLISLADDNKDDRLSLDEVLDNAELFLGSKMVDIGRNFHDEF